MTFLTWSTKEFAIVNVFSLDSLLFGRRSVSLSTFDLVGIVLRFLASASQPCPFNAPLPPSLPVACYLGCAIDFSIDFILLCCVTNVRMQNYDCFLLAKCVGKRVSY